jgi:hypothetical protein
VVAAIGRYETAGAAVPAEWTAEHEELVTYLAAHRLPAPAASQADGELREAIADLATELTSGRWDAQVGAAYLHADAVLALPAVRRLLADAAKVQRVRDNIKHANDGAVRTVSYLRRVLDGTR